ncbi:MAG: HDOD domain-containing protein [Planctomycetaceae bacterium]|jgi:HD-like signal output (HDOD) protein|nr:HDOD domain-containing protein [Planctomycetaceae bacterium]
MSVNIQETPATGTIVDVNRDLAALLKQEQLPAMPHSALSILQLDSDLTKVNIHDIVHPIEADPGLAAQVLKFLNSAFFGFQNHITNIKQGIALAGFRIVKNFVLWKAVFSLMPRTESTVFNIKQLWQDSLRRALFAKQIAQGLRATDSDLAFIGALLQDMAIPLLLKRKPQVYSDLLLKLQNEPEKRLSRLESEKLGWNHAVAAGVMCRIWKIPDDLASLIANHIIIEPFLSDIGKNASQISVSLSAFLPSVTGKKWNEQEALMYYTDKIFPNKPTLIPDFFDLADREYTQYANILQISQPSKKLTDYLGK